MELYKLIRGIDKIIIACWIGLLLCAVLQCFVFSKDADLVGLRHYDDLAFHLELNRCYSDFSLETLIKINGYGYGWIYWLLVMVYCLPGWLLCRNNGISWLLMVTPRLVSVALTAAAAIVFYKLISLYTKDTYVKAAALFLMPLFPTLNFYSSLFSCNPHVAFFGILAVYLIAKNREVSDSDLRWSLLCLAVAGGIKITAVLILPIWGLLLLNRYEWRFSVNDVKKLSLNGLVFFALCVFFISPQFYIGIFKKEYLNNILTTLSWATSFGSEGDSSFLVNIKNGVMKSTYFIPVYFVLFVLFILLICRGSVENVDSKEKRTFSGILKNDFFCYLLGYAVAVVLLCLKIQHGTLFITYYYTAICFVLPLGLVYLEKIKGKKIILVSLLLAQCLFIGVKVSSYASDSFFAYYDRYHDLKESGSMNEILYLRDKIFDGLEEKNEEIKVAFDGASPHFVNPVKHQNAQIYTIWQDFAQQSKTIEPDAIVMVKDWLSEQYRSDHYEDYMARMEFVHTGRFHNSYYVQAANTENYLLFLKEDHLVEKKKWKIFLGGGVLHV